MSSDVSSNRTLQSDTGRDSVGARSVLLFGVFGAPFAWALQLVANYAFAALACSNRGSAQMTPLPGWHDERVFAFTTAGIALLIAVISLLSAWRVKQNAARRSLLEHGVERTRVLANCGLLSAGIFLFAIVFSLAVALEAPQCTG